MMVMFFVFSVFLYGDEYWFREEEIELESFICKE